jgi:hypothetical protein
LYAFVCAVSKWATQSFTVQIPALSLVGNPVIRLRSLLDALCELVSALDGKNSAHTPVSDTG